MSITHKIINKLEERSFYNDTPQLYTRQDVENLLEIKEIEHKITKLEESHHDVTEIYKLKDELEDKSRKYFRY